jgi:hypothetical protein
LALESNNPAWARESRPGPAGTVHRSGPAGIPQSGPAVIKIWWPGGKSRPGRILLIRPNRAWWKMAACWREPSRSAAQPGSWPGRGTGGRPTRGGRIPAQPGRRAASPPGERKRAGEPRPSQGAEAGRGNKARPGNLARRPSRGEVSRPSRRSRTSAHAGERYPGLALARLLCAGPAPYKPA